MPEPVTDTPMRAARERLGISAAQVCAQTGISRKSLERFEGGAGSLSTHNLYRWAQALGNTTLAQGLAPLVRVLPEGRQAAR
ncbi:hypothetical protein GCM10017562_59890 [Streptomyces roseofulvus]|uniref:helix-turn-helix domain-containing protein n=1 Tax=Streptomyces roseofulvus TaxID=33902 RepID=UPI0031FBB1EF